MLKKVISIIFSLCFIFSMAVMAENQNTAVENIPEVSQGGSRGSVERPNGGRMGMPPSGDFVPPQGDFVPAQGDFKPAQGEFTPPQNSGTDNNTQAEKPQADAGVTEENQQTQESTEESNQVSEENPPFGGQMPESMEEFFGNKNAQNAQQEQETGFLGFIKTYSAPVTSVVLLGLAYIFVIFYKRKRY